MVSSRIGTFALVVALGSAFAAPAAAQTPQVVLDRGPSTIVLEPYAPNVVRVTLSLDKTEATAAPGFGFVASPAASGWTASTTERGDVYRSSRLIVTVAAGGRRGGTVLPTMLDIAKYFGGSTPGANITFTTTSGKKLLELVGWSMSVPNTKDGNAMLVHELRPGDKPFFRVEAQFVSPDDEHYYGLGQQQEGALDYRGRTVRAWHDYLAPGGPSVGVPFAITNYGYGLVWDNPSRTTVAAGFNERTKWSSEVGNRVSFFVIAGETTDEIYTGYRLLTGAAPMLPKAAYGYIQCKQRYTTQEELLGVAREYRKRKLPLDVIVLDWFYYAKMGEFDFVPERFPDPAAMNRELHDLGIETMVSVWPRFTKDTRHYEMLAGKRWLTHTADGTPLDGLPYDRAGADIDTTNPDAARWFWDLIRDNVMSKGFDSLWADQTEPDLPPDGAYFHVGPGTRYFNIYPLVHTQALYEGFRRDFPNKRALILARDAYLGAQRNGAMFWSSDIHPTWDTLRRQVPTGLGYTASGMPYWSNDIGGWEYLPPTHTPARPPLLDPSDARDNVGGYDDYPELYTRWFQYAAFTPIFRAHGSRKFNEVWSYGKAAEPILIKYLKLRYELMPYIYSLGFGTHQTGAPYMRALFMDFPNDPKVMAITDQYMFGPALLVAPVTEQGATRRAVYLPAGGDWYNFWTGERVTGGRTIEVAAPIDTLPLFVRAGSILPLGEPVEHTKQRQSIAKVRVYPGANATFTLYQDDGTTYAYEKGDYRLTRLVWDDGTQKFTVEGEAMWTVPQSALVEVVGGMRR